MKESRKTVAPGIDLVKSLIRWLVLLVFVQAAQAAQAVQTAQAQPTLLFVIADTGDCRNQGTAQVAAALKAQPGANEGTLLEVGDLAYPVATRERLLECHEPYWGSFRKRLAVPGNHDWSDPDAAGFFSIFPQPVPRKAPLDSDGIWQALLLDSNLRGAAWDAQTKWLETTLAQSKDECLIAAWHHPRWSSGRHGDNAFTQALWERMQRKVTLTLHGHDHHFEALPALDAQGSPSPAGVESFIVGNGGAYLYQPGSKAYSKRTLFGIWGFMRLELEGAHYRWQAIGVDRMVKDSGAGMCQTIPRNR